MISLMRKLSPMRTSTTAGTVGKCGKNIEKSKNVPNHLLSQYHCMFGVGAGNSRTERFQFNSNDAQHFAILKRSSSSLENHIVAKSNHFSTQHEIRELMTVYPDIVNDLVETVESYKCNDLAESFRKTLEYNLPLSNRKHGIIPVLTYRSIVQGQELTSEKIKLAQILGWCIEIVHVLSFIADDVVDNSVIRRGKVCWYKLDGVGLNVIHDSILLENGIFKLLRKHFSHLNCYTDLFELFFECIFKCICGQSTDVIVSTRHVNSFDMDTFYSVMRNKTASNFFYLPVAAGLLLSGVKDEKIFEECQKITFELGYFTQVQNDFLDSFGNPDFTGKFGTDIECNKCSWLAVKCMELADPEQRAVMEECYGQKDPQKIDRVRKLYEEMGLHILYAQFEVKICNRIQMQINQTPVQMLSEVFLECLNYVYKRGVK